MKYRTTFILWCCFVRFPNNLKTVLLLRYHWYRCWNGYWHVQSERYNLSAPIQPTAISNYMRGYYSYGEKNFLKATHGLYPHPQTWEHTQTHTNTLSSCCGAGISLRNSSMTDGQNPLSPLSHTETLGIQRKVMFVCVLKWSFICPSFFYYNKFPSHT